MTPELLIYLFATVVLSVFASLLLWGRLLDDHRRAEDDRMRRLDERISRLEERVAELRLGLAGYGSSRKKDRASERHDEILGQEPW
ncbi:MAG: hypothetical protein QN198_11240 [Armatimonadota bacterium]|nr:hypothetical protein [Armatimonadota bacterium]MDR5704159.1 hypothetical protein [Armatimonadota bacterium]MDR7435980.1 hypothetical protein [Armatimonadota bacterium]